MALSAGSAKAAIDADTPAPTLADVPKAAPRVFLSYRTVRSHACERPERRNRPSAPRIRPPGPVIGVASTASSVYRNNDRTRITRHFEGTAQ